MTQCMKQQKQTLIWTKNMTSLCLWTFLMQLTQNGPESVFYNGTTSVCQCQKVYWSLLRAIIHNFQWPVFILWLAQVPVCLYNTLFYWTAWPLLIQPDRKKCNFPCFTHSQWSVWTTALAAVCLNLSAPPQTLTEPERERARAHTSKHPCAHTHAKLRTTLHPLYKCLVNHILIST